MHAKSRKTAKNTTQEQYGLALPKDSPKCSYLGAPNNSEKKIQKLTLQTKKHLNMKNLLKKKMV